MSDNDLKCAKFVTATCVGGVVVLLLGLAALWHWSNTAIITESMRSGYTQELYASSQQVRWTKSAAK